MPNFNKVTKLKCSSDFLDIRWVQNVKELKVNEKTIVVNLGNDIAPIISNHDDSDHQQQVNLLNEIKKYINPWSSCIYRDIVIESASLLLLISTPFIDNPDVSNRALASFPGLSGEFVSNQFLINEEIREQVINKENWELYYYSIPEDKRGDIERYKYIPLFVTPDKNKTVLGTISFNPYKLIGQESSSSKEEEYYILSYIWFSPEQTNVGIHNQHNFIEIHTQITGMGRMQKFIKNDLSTLDYDCLMLPGMTNTAFCVVNPDDATKYYYPWHQYYSDSDCVWLVTEFYPKSVFEKDHSEFLK